MSEDEIREKYENLLSLAVEVKQENTDEFMRYWEKEIRKHLDHLDFSDVDQNESW